MVAMCLITDLQTQVHLWYVDRFHVVRYLHMKFHKPGEKLFINYFHQGAQLFISYLHQEAQFFKSEITAVGIHQADHVTPSIRKRSH
jgi:hypothetical protein